MNTFSYSHHGTMFVYPLQVRLYHELIGEMDPKRGSEDFWVTEELLLDRLCGFGFKAPAIRSEISRSCYAALLRQKQQENKNIYKLSPWGRHIIESLFTEAHWQPAEIALKVARRGTDSFQIVIRDTSFLTGSMRTTLNLNGLKPQPIFELRRNRLKASDLTNIEGTILTRLNEGKVIVNPDTGVDTLLYLIERFGKYYNSISDRYVHYLLPYHSSWQISQLFENLCRTALTIGRGPLEWRGSPFTEEELYTRMDGTLVPNELPFTIPEKQQCFQSLIEMGFIRVTEIPGKYTLTGQGAIWLDIFFRVIDENYSCLDMTIRSIDERYFWLRIANSTFLPDSIRETILKSGTKETKEWFYIPQMDKEQVQSLLDETVSALAIWKKGSPGK